MSLLDEELDMLGEDEMALLTKMFERLHENQVKTRTITHGHAFIAASRNTSWLTEGPIRRPERGGEWEPLKILLQRENSADAPNSHPRIPAQVYQGHVVTTDLPNLGTNPKQS
jgi:hypothetical protein